MKEALPQMLCLDGACIRRIREEKKFTQLYVAKVVGVTTDTISRWENNRYPSVKRQNAVLLARALETDVRNILRNEAMEDAAGEGASADSSVSHNGSRQAQPESGPAVSPSPGHLRPKRRRVPRAWGWLSLLFGVVLFALYALFPFAASEAPSTNFALRAQRLLFPFSAPGTRIPVRIRLEGSGDSRGYILKESFPKGWRLVQSSPPPSSLDNEKGTVRWIVRPEENPVLISYLVEVPADAIAQSLVEFEGQVTVTGGGRIRIGGDSRSHVMERHWADLNGDHVIDDVEVLGAYETIEELTGFHLDWDTVVGIWDAGGYGFDSAERRFIPARPLETDDSSNHLPARVRPGLGAPTIMASCL